VALHETAIFESMKNGKMKVLWFSNTPGLGKEYLKMNVFGEGWISALQSEIENSPEVELGFVFYSDQAIPPFQFNNTNYFPVQKIANTPGKRFLYRLTSKIEYRENVDAFVRIVEEFKPDIIHIQGTENPFGLISKQVKNIPIVISIQGNLSAYTSRYFAGMKMPDWLTQIKAGYPYPQMDYALWKKRVDVEKEILSDATYVLGRTHWDRRICRILAPRATYFHLEELMREKFYHAKWQQPANPSPVFFTTSSGAFYKGLETLIESARLLTSVPFNFTWKVAGLSETDSVVKLIKRITSAPPFSQIQIELLGRLSEDELIGQMKAADIYVQVSHIENSPNSLCEAMLLGMPIIASFAGGTSSLIDDGKTGILVQDGDPYVLAGALMELANNKEKALQMGAAAMNISHQRHNAQQITSALVKTYADIINNQSSN